jgi:hypothetical protein
MPPKHVEIYLKFHDYRIQSDVMCEMCSRPADEIHHITAKGMGGNPEADCIENLIALCRRHHDMAHGKIKGEVLTEDQLYGIIRDK